MNKELQRHTYLILASIANLQEAIARADKVLAEQEELWRRADAEKAKVKQ